MEIPSAFFYRLMFCFFAVPQVMTYNSGLFIAVLVGGDKLSRSGVSFQFLNEIFTRSSPP